MVTAQVLSMRSARVNERTRYLVQANLFSNMQMAIFHFESKYNIQSGETTLDSPNGSRLSGAVLLYTGHKVLVMVDAAITKNMNE